MQYAINSEQCFTIPGIPDKTQSTLIYHYTIQHAIRNKARQSTVTELRDQMVRVTFCLYISLALPAMTYGPETVVKNQGN